MYVCVFLCIGNVHFKKSSQFDPTTALQVRCAYILTRTRARACVCVCVFLFNPLVAVTRAQDGTAILEKDIDAPEGNEFSIFSRDILTAQAINWDDFDIV